MICSEEHCTRIATYTYNYEGPKGCCTEHLQVVQFRLTALGKMGPMHPYPVVFHREFLPTTPSEEARQRIRDLEAHLATLIDGPAVIEQLTASLTDHKQSLQELQIEKALLQEALSAHAVELDLLGKDNQRLLDQIRALQNPELERV